MNLRARASLTRTRSDRVFSLEVLAGDYLVALFGCWQCSESRFKSGMLVQDPNSKKDPAAIIQNILKKAAE
jgi:hypothetical protein